MRKFMVKCLALILVVITSFSTIACNNTPVNTGETDGKTIEVKAVIAGYDVDWLNAIIAEFNKVYADEGYEVKLTLADTQINATNEIKRPKYCTTDIFFEYNNIDTILPVSYSILKEKGTSLLEDLTDVWNSPAIGIDKKPQGKPLIERVKSDFLIDAAKFHGIMEGFDGLYGLYWQGGTAGVYVNPNVLGDYTLDDLLTTDDWLNVLSALAPDPTNKDNLIDENGFFPVAWSQKKTAGYFNELFQVLVAQYEGKTSHSKFINLEPDTGTIEDNGFTVYEKRGIYEAFKVIEKVLNRDWCSPRTSAQDHVQAEALVAMGKAACMVTGDYMYKELEKDYANEMKNVISIKVPVISALGVKLNLCGTGSHDEEQSCANCNAKLREIVKAVDEGTATDSEIALAQGVTEEKVKIIRESRGYFCGYGGGVQSFIPAYSDAKKGAKLFLRFMYSDEMMKLYREKTYVDLPFEYTNEPAQESEAFKQAMYEKISAPNAVVIQGTSYSRLRAQIPMYPKQNTVVATFQGLSYSHQYGKPLYTALGIYEDNIEYVKSKWSTYLQAAGY